MAGSVDNPRIWAGADIFVAPVGSTGPTDVDTDLDAAFKALGLLGEDGLELGRESDSTDHFAYGGIKVRNTRTKHKRTFKVVALEDNEYVFGLVNPGSTVSETSGLVTRTVKIPVPDERAFVVEMSDGDILRRVYIPRGEVVEVGPSNIDDDNMSSVELTIEAYTAADGTFYIELTDDPQAIPA